MASVLRTLVNDEPGNTRAKVIALYGILLVFNLAAWCWALVAFHLYPVLLGTAFLAYSFGLRHAVDADHIAAIDNVTRKLMQEGKRPFVVGFMFSLGHSTVVIVGSIAIAATALALQHRIVAAREIGGLIGTLVSTLFLFGIAIVISVAVSKPRPNKTPSGYICQLRRIMPKTGRKRRERKPRLPSSRSKSSST